MSGMTNWPQHFIDAGFTDAEIVPGVAYPRWRFYEGDFWLTSKPGCMVLEWQHSINHRMTIAIDPDGVVYTSYNKAAIWPMSLSLAHQAAEDLVCRLHGVPTAAEREVERLKFRVVEVENAIRVIGQQVSRTRTQFNIQDEPNDVEKQENKND